MSENFVTCRNAQPVPRGNLSATSFELFREELLARVADGARLVAFTGIAAGDKRARLLAVLAEPGSGLLRLGSADVRNSYPSLTCDCPAAHLFERELAEDLGIVPDGHPWLKPVRFPPGTAAAAAAEPGRHPFFRVEGEGVHEVAVGPVHAGVIEPGHFRFSCLGEEVLHLEIVLGYQHRGIERELARGLSPLTMHLLETVAGDTTAGHAVAGCQLLEALGGAVAPPRAQWLRGVLLELERLANHVGDLGAMAGDVGYLPTGQFCGRLRGDYLNLTAQITGSRFGRGAVRPGGMIEDVDAQRVERILERLDGVWRDTAGAVGLLWTAPSVLARFENAGQLSAAQARDLGLVGVAARASGIDLDARRDHPEGLYRFAQVPVSTWHTGDVFARAQVRWLEMQRSADLLRESLGALPGGPVRVPVGALAPSTMVISLVEGWRGEICHLAGTDEQGKIDTYRIVDPSFHNWAGLALAMRNGAISDFPLCNKSFNLSYCGHDR